MQFPKLKKLPPLPKLNLSRFLGLVNQNRNTIFILGALGVFALNLLLLPFSFRLDFSQNQAHTISSATKQNLRSLKQNVTLILFQSAQLPSQITPFKQDVHDMLQEYRREGGGKVIVEVKDPKTDEKAMQEAVQNGIPEIRFSQVEQDNYNVSTGFFGLLVKYGEQTRAVNQLSDLGNLEYNITSAIYALSRTETPKIAVAGGSPGISFQQFGQGDPLAPIKEVLGQQYTVTPLEFSAPPVPAASDTLEQPSPVPSLPPIDQSIKTVVLFTNDGKQYSNEDIARLNTYVKNKGTVIALLDGISVEQMQLATSEAQHNLFTFTDGYGITVNKDLVLSGAAEVVNFGDQVQSMFIPYPFWFKTSNFTRDTGFFSNANYLTFPWGSTITLNDKSGFTVRELIKTDPQSWRETGPFSLQPAEAVAARPTATSEYVVAAEATGQNGGKVMVISSSRFLSPQFLSQQAGNLNFLLNVVNDYASDGALAGIRQRAVQIYPLPALDKNAQEIVKYGNMFLLPVIFVLGGAMYLIRRK